MPAAVKFLVAVFIVQGLTACAQSHANDTTNLQPNFVAEYEIQREERQLSSDEKRRADLYDARNENSEMTEFAVKGEQFRARTIKRRYKDPEVGIDSDLQKVAQRLDEAAQTVGVPPKNVESLEEINREEVFEHTVETVFENARTKQKLVTSEKKISKEARGARSRCF